MNDLNNKSEELFQPKRTEEVEYIIESIPSSFGFYVTFISCTLFCLVLGFGWFIKYPEVLQGQISISAINPNAKIIAIASGKLEQLNYSNGEYVSSGMVIAMIKNGAVLKDVQILDSLLQRINISSLLYTKHRNYFPKKLSIGELSTKYYTFLNSLFQILDYDFERPFEVQKEMGENLYKMENELIENSNNTLKLLKLKSAMAKSLNNRDSLLLRNMAISQADVEKSFIYRISSEQEMSAIDKEITNNNFQLKDSKIKLKELKNQKIEKERELELNLYNSYFDLIENIKEWKHKYVLYSPISGKIDFKNFFKVEDLVTVGEELFTVVPIENKIIGEVFLPEQGAGKVKPGQEVIIKLDNYPYFEYGSVKGIVKSISLVTSQQPTNMQTMQPKINTHMILVDLPKGLLTNYGSLLSFHFEAKGTAEIVTADKRLLNRLFDNLKYRLK